MGDLPDCVHDLLSEALEPLDGLSVMCGWWDEHLPDEARIRILVQVQGQTLVDQTIDTLPIGCLALVETVLATYQRPLAAAMRQQATMQTVVSMKSYRPLMLV